MRTPLLPLAALAAAAAVAVAAPLAAGAVQTGQYTGQSQNTVITRYGQLTPAVQKGTVAFKVGANRITSFRLRGQKAQCPGTPAAVVIDVTIPSMPLWAAGTATGEVENDTFGPITVTVRVRGNGTATGKVAYLPQCGKATTFTAAKR